MYETNSKKEERRVAQENESIQEESNESRVEGKKMDVEKK